jgi:hypothetical protein
VKTKAESRINAALALHWEESTVTGIPTVKALKGGEK